MIDSNPDKTFNIGQYNNAHLGDFLSRPIRIYEHQWLINTDTNVTINPWSLFFNQPAVLKRVANFSRLRCRLHVKVVVNGTPFHYGRMMMSYEPLPDFNENAGDTGLTHRRTMRSQRPCVYLNPADNVGGEMILPFFYYDNWLTSTTNDFAASLGSLTFDAISLLKSANGGTEPVTFSVFAWAEDAEMCVPSVLFAQSEDCLVPQAKSSVKVGGHSEYNEPGIVSAPASAIANAAGALTSVPIIGPFAMATQIGANAISKIGKIFGFSRPPILEKTVFYKPKLLSDLATCDSAETVTKLTVDSKQELTIDPRTTGLSGEDELSLSVLAQKSTLLTSFVWTTTTVSDTQLFAIHVAPMLEHYQGFANGMDAYTPTSLSYTTWPFANWSGSLKFRFQIVRSNFHNGRLQFVYEPEGASNSTGGQFNTVYNQIVDIAHIDDFEMEIAWTKDEPYLPTGWDKTAQHWITDTNILNQDPFSNGTLVVNVVNELNAPINSADVEILVYVSAGEDFELCNPTEHNIKESSYNIRLLPQSNDVLIAQSDDIPIEITHPDEAPINLQVIGSPEVDLADQKNQIFYGEKISSFRTLLRRYNRYRTWAFPTNTHPANDHTESIMYQYNRPKMRGYEPNAYDTNSNGLKYNFVSTSLFNYLVPAYVGWRGGLRYKMNFTGDLYTGRIDRVYNPIGAEIGTVGTFVHNQKVKSGDPAKVAAYNGVLEPSMMSGSMLQPLKLSPIMEFEQPFATGKRFAMAKSYNTIQTVTGMDKMLTRVAVDYKSETTKTIATIEQYMSVGEDFNVFFFLNAPIRYEYTDPAPSV